MSDIVITPSGRTCTFPLPIFASLIVGGLQAGDDEFDIVLGLSETLVRDLKAKSLDASDTAIQEHTSDRERFGTGSYDDWYSKGRVPFALVHRGSGALAALVWLGPKPLGRKSMKYLSDDEKAAELVQHEEVWHTLVYRSYAPFRGKGLMRPFARFCIDEYRRAMPEAKLWVGMNASNEASARLATSLGFVKRGDLYDAEKNWQGMVLE